MATSDLGRSSYRIGCALAVSSITANLALDEEAIAGRLAVDNALFASEDEIMDELLDSDREVRVAGLVILQAIASSVITELSKATGEPCLGIIHRYAEIFPPE